MLAVSGTREGAASHSSRVRGLKQKEAADRKAHNNVALFASAWIETIDVNHRFQFFYVALFASAWIETME